MRSFLKCIDRRFYIFALAWTILQLVLIIVFYNEPMGNDAKGYEAHAIQNYNLGTFYPSKANLYDVYVQGPGLVNTLIPVYAIFGSVRPFMFISLLMNVAILFEVLYLGIKFFSPRCAYIAAVLYALLLSNIFVATQINTEVLYLFLALTGFCLSTGRHKWCYALSGILYAMAWTVRPLVLAFAVASIVLFIYERRQCVAKSIINVAFMAVPLVILACVNQQRLGTPLISSSTGGYNLLMTAWDGATPLPNHSIYYSVDGFANKDIVSHLTFYERDQKWKHEALTMIGDHPFTYVKLCIERIGIMWNKDTWDIPSLLGHLDDPTYASSHGLHGDYVSYQIIRMTYSLLFYIICILAIIGIIRFRNQILSVKGIPLIVLTLGIGGTCLLPMEQRLHYPYIWVVCLCGAMEIEYVFWKHNNIH